MLKKITLMFCGVLLAITSACSILPRNNEPIDDDQSELVARDLSGALALLRGYSPRNTMLQLRPAKTRFGHSLERALRAQGYGLQNIPDNDTGPMLVTYQVEAFENASGKSVGYRVPSSMNSSSTPLIGDDSLPMAAPDNEQRPALSSGMPIRKRNVLDIGQSNFASIMQDYEELSSDVLVFANDSLRLGTGNKAMLSALTRQFDAQTDLVSLIGCSHGPSAKSNGNEHLAIGRANRVKEELILANISAENILDEGCWASTAQDGLPARGVIVRMLRRTVDS